MGSNIFKWSNLRKTCFYLRKNGIRSAYYAACERIMRESTDSYCYEALSDALLKEQSKASEEFNTSFSILVPAFETVPEYLKAMIDSVREQSYGKWELIIADASKTDKVETVVREYEDERIRYIRLWGNKGISVNTNRALECAEGDYAGLLDHDDTLTPDALYEMAKAIDEAKKKGIKASMLYSDEDKGNSEMTVFYEPHRKPDLNLDLLLSNNYICHFLVMKKELMKELGFRKDYDGAQDYDLILRGVGRLLFEREKQNVSEREKGRMEIIHIPKVLYHWRCYTSSTAENPGSKKYAYKAGGRAIEDFMKRRGWKGRVHNTAHLGFYRIQYEKGIFAQRKEVGAVGGKLIDRKGRVAGGIYEQDGTCPYLGLHRHFSGYMHRASLAQEAYALSITGICIRKELEPVFEEVFGVPYDEEGLFIKKLSLQEKELRELEMEFGRRLRRMGYTQVWIPDNEIRI